MGMIHAAPVAQMEHTFWYVAQVEMRNRNMWWLVLRLKCKFLLETCVNKRQYEDGD